MRSVENSGEAPTPPGPAIPRQFAGLSLTEFWERFALAGLKSMLTLLLINHVLSPEAGAVGTAWLQDRFDAPSGSGKGPVALASYIYGAVNALVYLSIPLGGLVGDLLIGRRASVLTGGASMIVGLLMMMSLHGFLPGLLLFAIGTGLFKGNLSAQFGALFAEETRRRRAYSYYLISLNAGVIAGPLAMGAVALAADWQTALALAAVGIAAGLAIYMALVGPTAGRRTPPSALLAGCGVATAPRATEPGALARLLLALLAVYLCFAAYGQIGNIVLVWAERRVDLAFGGWTLPVGWVLALDGLFTILLVVAVQAALRFALRRGFAIGPFLQIGLGCLACAAGYVVLAVAEWTGGAMLSPVWMLAYLFLVDLAIVLVWPSGLSLATGLAPGGKAGLWGGIFYLHGFFANLWVGFAGGLFEALAAPSFWLLHAAIALAGAAVASLAVHPALRPDGAGQAITTSA